MEAKVVMTQSSLGFLSLSLNAEGYKKLLTSIQLRTFRKYERKAIIVPAVLGSGSLRRLGVATSSPSPSQ